MTVGEPLIEAIDLTKTYPVRRRQRSLLAALRSRFFERPQMVLALDQLNFSLRAGEMVGLIGANGAGKSTTIKLMTGILHPSSGTVRVFGKDPTEERRRNAYRFGVVMGQRSHLWWDLPAFDSFELYRRMYSVSRHDFTQTMAMLSELLDLHEFIDTPVRQLSLGQRMRCELASALIHRPSVLFLDEPTIGIDVLAKANILSFIRRINTEWQSTVLITTHNLNDLEKLVSRIVIIDRGKLVYNGALDELKRLGTERQIDIVLREPVDQVVAPGTRVVRVSPYKLSVFVQAGEASVRDVASALMQNYPVADIVIQEADIETIVRKIYEAGAVEVETLEQVGA